jgi:hypothetical protein
MKNDHIKDERIKSDRNRSGCIKSDRIKTDRMKRITDPQKFLMKNFIAFFATAISCSLLRIKHFEDQNIDHTY